MGVRNNEESGRLNCAMDNQAESINEKYLDGMADIPECRDQMDLDEEYRDFPEEQIWSPRDAINEWLALYVFMARSVLTFVQENQGIPNREAMENSCTGYAEQYITDVLHDCEYVPEVALKTLLTKELPRKLVTRWTATDTELFIKGIARHGKNFLTIQKDMLPQKCTKDIVDFYYAWKWSEPAKALRGSRRRRRHSKTKRRFPSIGYIFSELAAPKIVTRSVSAAHRESSPQKQGGILGRSAFKNSAWSNLVTKRRRRNSMVSR